MSFQHSKLKFVKVSLFHSFHRTETPTAGHCFKFICDNLLNIDVSIFLSLTAIAVFLHPMTKVNTSQASG